MEGLSEEEEVDEEEEKAGVDLCVVGVLERPVRAFEEDNVAFLAKEVAVKFDLLLVFSTNDR